MGVLTFILTLVSVLSSSLVQLSSAIGTLRKGPSHTSGTTFLYRLRHLDDWQLLQVSLSFLDSFLLLAVTPLFVYYALKQTRVNSIWDIAFDSLAPTSAMAIAMVVRPISSAALAGSNYLRIAFRRHSTRLLLGVATVSVACVAAAAAISCSQLSKDNHASCSTVSPIKIIIIAVQVVFASLATAALIATVRNLPKARSHNIASHQHHRPLMQASRAPSLSLLIHTQPDAWTRTIDLDIPSANGFDGREVHTKTDFGPTIPCPQKTESSANEVANIDYGPKMVQGILGDTGGSGRMTDAATTSLGYGSAVASSTNPYHLGSTFSLASRDVLGGFSRSKLDLVTGKSASGSKHQYSTSKSCSSQNGFGALNMPSRTPPEIIDENSFHHPGTERSARQLTETEPTAERNSLPIDQGVKSKEAIVRMMSCMLSLWIPIALSATALLMRASRQQAFILLSSFCIPASVLLLQELVLSSHQGLKVRESSRNQIGPSTMRSTSREEAGPSRHASWTSSIVVLPDAVDSLRNRRPHFRSFSCPLESELNGYSSLGWDTFDGSVPSKQRQSLSSARSVPYLDKHWTAGKIQGDRVVAPRSSLIRGLNLMLNPKPKLEILPVQVSTQSYRGSRVGDTSYRDSTLPAAVTSAIVEGLLAVPPGHGHISTDSERTCITHCYSQGRTNDASFVSTLHPLRDEQQGLGDMSTHLDRSIDLIGQESTDVVLNMDDTPGSARFRPNIPPQNDHSDLQSPTKRQITTNHSMETPRKAGESPTVTSSFSRNDNSQIMGSSVSRLFSEIMDMVRATGQTRPSDQPRVVPFGQNFKRTPPRGYASIDGTMNRHEESVYGSAHGDGGTVIVHPDESSCDFRTAGEQSGRNQSSFTSPCDIPSEPTDQTRPYEGGSEESAGDSRQDHTQEESGLLRKCSASSTLSFSSISSRFRPIGRGSTSGTPLGSPNRTREQTQVKKMRSRTFASAFGIELNLLSRNGSKGRRDTPGSHVDSSPSTSAGTCPSSLMDLSFSPSPVSSAPITRAGISQIKGTPSPGEHSSGTVLEGTKPTHRRNQSRADSIMDLLDDESGDAIEEMLDLAEVASCASLVDTPFDGEVGEWRISGVEKQSGGSHRQEVGCVGSREDFDDLCEVDLGDVTVNDAWERSFPLRDACEEEDGGVDQREGRGESIEEDQDDLMGFDLRRLVARAPFLDTVEEESEDCAEDQEEQAWDQSNEKQNARLSHPYNVKGGEQEAPSGSSSVNSRLGIKEGDKGSRESLLLEREASQRQIMRLLAEHETMFPHKTLSQIEEVTEVTATLRASGFRTNSAASNSKLPGDKTSSTPNSSSIHLGLPLSLRCQGDVDVDGVDSQDTDSLTSTESLSGETRTEGAQDDPSAGSGNAANQLRFVTPRSRMRCRVAADRKAENEDSGIRSGGIGLPKEVEQTQGQPLSVDPSPRSVGVRLGQLGMDHGIWMQSPLKLDLENSAASCTGRGGDDEGSFEIVDASTDGERGQARRFKRRLTLMRGKLGAETKGAVMKLKRLDHHDSPKRELRNRLARASAGTTGSTQSGLSAERRASGKGAETLRSWDGGQAASSPKEKRLPHKPIKKRRRSRIKGVAVMIARHQFTVVDEDDSLVQRLSTSHAGASYAHS